MSRCTFINKFVRTSVIQSYAHPDLQYGSVVDCLVSESCDKRKSHLTSQVQEDTHDARCSPVRLRRAREKFASMRRSRSMLSNTRSRTSRSTIIILNGVNVSHEHERQTQQRTHNTRHDESGRRSDGTPTRITHT